MGCAPGLLGVGIEVLVELFTGPQADEGDELEVRDDKVFNLTTGKSFAIEALPKARQAIIDAGGLIPYTRQLLLDRAV